MQETNRRRKYLSNLIQIETDIVHELRRRTSELFDFWMIV